MKWRKAQENNADRKSPFWFQAYEIPYGLSRKYIYLYNFYSSVNVVDSSVIGLGLFLRVTHKFTKCLFRRWMSDKKKYLYIFFNKKTNQNSLNFVSMRFFHHRVMFFSLLLRCWYFISFLSPILAIWISVLYSVEAIQIIKFHMRSGKFVRIIISPASICICLRNEFKAKIIWLFLFEFRYFFSFCLSTHSLFFSPRNHLCCRLGRTYNTHFG